MLSPLIFLGRSCVVLLKSGISYIDFAVTKEWLVCWCLAGRMVSVMAIIESEVYGSCVDENMSRYRANVCWGFICCPLFFEWMLWTPVMVRQPCCVEVNGARSWRLICVLLGVSVEIKSPSKKRGISVFRLLRSASMRTLFSQHNKPSIISIKDTPPPATPSSSSSDRFWRWEFRSSVVIENPWALAIATGLASFALSCSCSEVSAWTLAINSLSCSSDWDRC